MKMHHKAARSSMARGWADEFEGHQLTCSDAPDMSGVNRAAEASAQIAREAMDFYQRLYNKGEPDRKAAAKIAREQATVQRDLALESLKTTQEERERYKSTFQPLENKMAADALAYDTPQRREQEAGQAIADVDSQIALERQTALDSLAARGVDPSSGNVSLAMSRAAIGGGAAKAAAANDARRKVETIGGAKLADAAALGRGVVSNQATQAQIGLQAGNNAVSSANAPNVIAQQGAGTGYQVGIQGNNAAGQLYGQAAQGGQSDNSGLWSAVGTVAGAMLMSDKNMKREKKPVRGEAALAAARRIPVKTWKYTKGSPADDGGRPHVGPMAQDVQRVLGERAAPDGKLVDVANLTGVALAAVQALDKKVDRLAKRRHASAH